MTSYTPTLTYINCRACCIGCEFTEVEQVLLGWSRTIYYSKNHRERWCGGLWSSSRLQISVPALSLCHFPKMWVSLVNTLNPRPKEHIMASSIRTGWGVSERNSTMHHNQKGLWLNCLVAETIHGRHYCQNNLLCLQTCELFRTMLHAAVMQHFNFNSNSYSAAKRTCCNPLLWHFSEWENQVCKSRVHIHRYLNR